MNIIDDTNFPSANMRFFEIPTAGGLQITSACPEMEQVFKHREHLLYFKDTRDLSVQIEWALQNPDALKTMRQRAQQLIHQQHNYDQRLQTIVAAASL